MNLLHKGMVFLAAICLPKLATAQTNLNFNAVGVTTEGAIRLSWNSTSNEYYRIDYSSSLVDTNTGHISWNALYDDYVAQGTNTFWLDTGNYYVEPSIPHPAKFNQRFYRVTLLGTNDVPPPHVTVTFPTNGASLSGDVLITVAADTDQPLIRTKLYVDGEEQNHPISTTNYVSSGTNYIIDVYQINTCEWPNEPHVIFGTAKTESGLSGKRNVPAVLVGRAASTLVPVTFSNLITRFSFSQPFFTPEDGQTQQVSAIFSANVNWTLEVQNASTSTVCTATGSGGSLAYDWDGTGQGGTNLPVGNYTFLLTVQTNGQPLSLSATEGVDSAVSVTSGSDDSESTRLWVQQANGAVVPLAIYPPGINTNDFDIFEAPVSWNPYKRSTSRLSFSSSPSTGAEPMAAWAGGSSQSTRGPVRPPISPTRGRAGIFGIAYDTYRGVYGGYNLQGPFNGIQSQRVQLETNSGSTTFTYPVLWGYIDEARNFINEMKRGNWQMGFDRFDDALSIDDLRSSGANIFNTVKLGLFMSHGTFGTSQDFTAGGVKQMYFPVTAGAGSQYLRMSEMNLGSADTNGLKWMAFCSCNSLQQTAWQSMQNGGVHPNNGNLHLILGMATVGWTGEYVMSTWARYMNQGRTNGSPMKIESAWYEGPTDAYLATGFNYTNVIIFAAAGDSNCRDDYLLTNSPPTGSSFYHTQQVWP
jgi:hypothetical protein